MHAVFNHGCNMSHWAILDRDGNREASLEASLVYSPGEHLCAFTHEAYGFSDYLDLRTWQITSKRFRFAESHSTKLRVARVAISDANGDRYGIISESLEYVVEAMFSDIKKLTSHRIAARCPTTGLYGYVSLDRKNNFVPKYSHATSFCDEVAIVSLPNDDDIFYHIDPSEQIIHGPFSGMASEELLFSDDGIAMVADANTHEKYYINRAGETILVPDKNLVSEQFSCGLAKAWSSADGLFGYIDRCGRFVIPPQYEEAMNFVNGMALVQHNSEWMLIDRRDNVLKNTRSSALQNIDNKFNNRIIYKCGERYGYLNEDGDVIIQPLYTIATRFITNRAAVCMD